MGANGGEYSQKGVYPSRAMGDPASNPTRMLGLRDTALLVMGGIIGAGIFMNPHSVAKAVPSAAAALGAWALGGAVALAGGFIWAELAGRRPGIAGQYAYLRDGIHPSVGFLYGWSNLLVVQTGGMAAVAVTFATYTHAALHLGWTPKLTAAAALAALTIVNIAGVRAGGAVQSLLMAAKIVAIAALIVCGFLVAAPAAAAVDPSVAAPTVRGFFAAMIAVMFAYGGWATASFVSGEIEDQARTLPRGMLIGTIGVVLLYLGVNASCLRALGIGGLALTEAPVTAVVMRAIGPIGAQVLAVIVAVSAAGFLAQGMLVCPRVYFAMARDGLFFERLARLHPRTGVPHVAIALQGLLAIVTAISGTYEEILSWVVTADFVFLSATAATLFVFRARPGPEPSVRTPGHPWTTIGFIVTSMSVVAATFVEHPMRSTLGWAIVLAGGPVYALWRRARR